MSIVTSIYPEKNSTTATPTTLIYFNVYEVKLDSLHVRVNGQVAFDGSAEIFNYPYNGGDSLFSEIVDGYYVQIENRGTYANIVHVQVEALDLSFVEFIENWTFIVDNKVNVIYFSDGYGLKSIAIRDAAGESQEAVSTILAYPEIPSDNISSISGNFIDGYSYLTLSYADYASRLAIGDFMWGNMIYGEGYGGAGALVVRNELDLYRYSDGYSSYKSVMNDSGTLYNINLHSNSVEVYYGANFRGDTSRSPDYIYNEHSTPAIRSGQILELHVVSGVSTKLPSGTRLYVGTTDGFTRVETYDKEVDGYSTGEENRGISYQYGISGSGATYESIGGTVSRVISISSNETKGVIFVVTNDGYGHGGLTQIRLRNNGRIVFMTYESGAVPSNDIRDVFAEE